MSTMSPTTRRLTLAVPAALLVVASCGTPTTPARTGPPPQQSQPHQPPPEVAATDQRGAGTVQSVAIGQLAPDPAREIRVTGIVDQVVGMRLVPAKVIFKVRDNTGTVTAVINEKVELTEGQKIELVGHYMPIASPMHDGPGDAPEEPVLVVDRYLAF